MKKVFMGLLALFCIVGSVFVACNSDIDESIEPASSVEPELDNFFLSYEYEKASNSLELRKSDFVLEERVAKRPKKNVSYYTIPIRKDGVLVGQATIFSKNNGKVYRVVYEDLTGFSKEKGGVIRVLTGENELIASLNCTIDANGKQMAVKIDEVAMPSIKTKSTIEFPTSDEGWKKCFIECYKVASDACEGDPQCDFLCDLVNLGAGCTISIMLACGIYCI